MDVSIIAVLVFFAVAAATAAVMLGLRDLAAVPAARRAAGGGPVRLRRVARRPAAAQGGGPISRFDRWLENSTAESGLGIGSTEVVLAMLLAGMVLGGPLLLLLDQPVIAGIGLALGMGSVLGYLLVKRALRVRKLQEQLPFALDMIARGMKSGQSLDQALAYVGQESPEPIAAEFRHCAHQMKMGLSLPAAMRSLISRVRLLDMRVFTTALAVHRQTGGNLAGVMERLAAVTRERLNYRRQLRSVTGAGRLSAMLVAAIGPLLFAYMFLFHRDYISSMLESPIGQTLLVTAIVLELIGLIWTARLLKPMY